jgi:hypothetical protein
VDQEKVGESKHGKNRILTAQRKWKLETKEQKSKMTHFGKVLDERKNVRKRLVTLDCSE